MKKFIKALLVCLICLLVLRLVLGIVYKKDIEAQKFIMKDLPPLNLSKENGFFKLLSLNEPLEVDCNDPKVIAGYQKLFDPSKTSLSLLNEWYKQVYSKRKWPEPLKEIKNIVPPFETHPNLKEWVDFLKAKKDRLNYLAIANQIMIQRYESIIRSPDVTDLTNPQLDGYVNMYLVIKMSQFYSTWQILRAFDGKWENAVYNLVNQFQCLRKLSSTSRQIMTVLMSSVILDNSLRSLWIITIHPDCPQETLQVVLNKLSSPVKYKELIPDSTFKGEYLSVIMNYKKEIRADLDSSLFGKFLHNIFVDFNEIYQLFYNSTNSLIQFQGDRPYPQVTTLNESQLYYETNYSLGGYIKEIFDNGIGKKMLGVIVPSTTLGLIRRIYRTQVLQDTLLLTTEYRTLRRKGIFKKGSTVRLTYQREKDPFTGDTYSWDPEKETFYSQFLREEKRKEEIRRLEAEKAKKEGKGRRRRRRQR